MTKPKRVIVWGHKLHTHTHSYIHSSYFRAFRSLGIETYWLDSNDTLGSSDLEGTLFFSEDQAKLGMPVRPDCFYITHHFNESYLSAVPDERIVRLGNFTIDCQVHESVGNLCHFDSKGRALYQPWATNLLPNEIVIDNPREFDIESRACFYIGSIYDENIQPAQIFANACASNGIELRHVMHATDEQNLELTRSSLISVDFRGQHHIKVGYLPCRIFKSISYGVPIITNSRLVKELVDLPAIHLCEDPSRTLVEGIHFESKMNKSTIVQSMIEVKNNHTFANRIQNLFEVMFS